MTEDFLHYLWRFKKFNLLHLHTIQGESLQLIDGGSPHTDAGPDFNNARLIIGDQLWAGNVEIHVCSSDWKKHRHHLDAAYNNVILHVVYEDDVIICNAKGQTIPTLELKGRFDEQLYHRYQHLTENQNVIPCASQFPGIDSQVREQWVERMVIERLSQRTQLLTGLLKTNRGDWELTFYQWLCRGFGLKINADPMLILGRALPWKVFAKYRDNPMQIEAFLMGLAGWLEEPLDDYSKALQKEWSFLSHKHELVPLDPALWKYARLRPAAFPDLRMASLATLLHTESHLFSRLIQIGTVNEARTLLSVQLPAYWTQHYRLGIPASSKIQGPGSGFIDLLIVNVWVPFLFVYGHTKDEPFYKQRALDLLDQMNAENNKITRLYASLNYKPTSAFQSQGLLQLYQYYCKPKKCLNCAIGIDILKS